MSRSYKKFHIYKDRNKGAKQKANRRVRRALNQNLDLVLRNNDYRKYTCSYDISDYKFFGELSFDAYYRQRILGWYNWLRQYCDFPDREETYREWITLFRNK